MKLDRPLSPPLAHIEHSLFGVSPALIEAVERGETSSAIAEAVHCSPEWAARETAVSRIEPEEIDTTPSLLPPHLRTLIERRLTAREIIAETAEPIPNAGQIVELRQICTPKKGQLDWVMQVPLYVLLDAPAEAGTLWHGWLVSSEADYAGWWDFVLQDEDGPIEPDAAVVQLWNPLRVYLRMAERVVGRLSPARMQAVRALASEFVTGNVPTATPVWPGRVAQRFTRGELSVVTGSQLGGDEDPRHHYQHLYFHAAEAIREPARLVLAELASMPEQNSISAWLSRLDTLVAQIGTTLIPAPRVALAMSERDDEAMTIKDRLWDDLARISVLEIAADGAGRVQVTAESDIAVTCELRVSGVLEFKQTARRGENPVQIDWETGEVTTLTLTVADGRPALEFPLVRDS